MAFPIGAAPTLLCSADTVLCAARRLHIREVLRLQRATRRGIKRAIASAGTDGSIGLLGLAIVGAAVVQVAQRANTQINGRHHYCFVVRVLSAVDVAASLATGVVASLGTLQSGHVESPVLHICARCLYVCPRICSPAAPPAVCKMYSFSLEARRSHVLFVPVFMLLMPRVLWLPVPLSTLHVFIATIARCTDARLAVFFHSPQQLQSSNCSSSRSTAFKVEWTQKQGCL